MATNSEHTSSTYLHVLFNCMCMHVVLQGHRLPPFFHFAFFHCISVACVGMHGIRRHGNSVHDLQGGCVTANGVSWQPACHLPCRRRGLRHSASFSLFEQAGVFFPFWTGPRFYRPVSQASGPAFAAGWDTQFTCGCVLFWVASLIVFWLQCQACA